MTNFYLKNTEAYLDRRETPGQIGMVGMYEKLSANLFDQWICKSNI